MYIKKFLLSFFIYFMVVNVAFAKPNKPLTTDTRIRTLVFNENEVFKLNTRYGYQANIEFGKEEEINTISIGDPIPFNIIPDVDRIFIKPKQNGMKTNMTVVTNKRTYQIELSSETADDNDIMYVMRFYYPDEQYVDSGLSAGALKNPLPSAPPLPTAIRPFSGISSGNETNIEVDSMNLDKTHKDFNYKYSISGPENLSPSKIFDNGENTFIKITDNSEDEPKIYEVKENGKEQPLEFTKIGSFYAIEGVKKKLSIRWNEESNEDVICVFNEKI